MDVTKCLKCHACVRTCARDAIVGMPLASMALEMGEVRSEK